ncbi:hypothetical protein SAMN05444360_12174 [Chryseobacterium carnipullorum]|uniref:Uncharacterized protein n=1 Tax=Chryseobacterium carnipullorum TaxID=1124835 RepID=A0A1M7MLQ8_CHRCU|nr:hypothetical protein SAMN05444360_12174 [Chryseobacterium carnipullorum]STD00601.1 Uncharacterised protein [Chryseobacterium carnipullorum]
MGVKILMEAFRQGRLGIFLMFFKFHESNDKKFESFYISQV